MNEYQKLLSENSFGYGRWDAPYWFIGLEERLTPRETGNYAVRAAAFQRLNRDGLCDNFEFHSAIHQLEFLGSPGNLQPTWKRLIWLLKSYLHQPREDEDLLDYQCKQWGRSTGETLLTELDGLPFDNALDSTLEQKELRKEVIKNRPKRIEKLCCKLEQPPELVVMYGKTQQRYWNVIAGFNVVFDNAAKRGGTTFVFAPHPNMRGRTSAEWERLGRVISVGPRGGR